MSLRTLLILLALVVFSGFLGFQLELQLPTGLPVLAATDTRLAWWAPLCGALPPTRQPACTCCSIAI